MLGPSFTKLLSISSPPLRAGLSDESKGPNCMDAIHAADLETVLAERNGFFAFEGALRFFPSHSVPISYGMDEWNSLGLWKSAYGGIANEYFFFAEDIFGGQFCMMKGRICAFDPETGRVDGMANGLEDWATAILADYEVLTGYRLAREWQAEYGKLVGRHRLVPKTPFVAGGEFALSNLNAMDAAKGMRIRGGLACEIRGLPEGSRVRFTIANDDE